MEVEEIHRRIKKDEDVICSILKKNWRRIPNLALVIYH